MPPDFTGTWTLDLEKSEFGFLPPPKSRVDRIEQTAELVRIMTRQVDSNGDNTIERALPLDGQVVDVMILGRVRKVSVRWDGAELVIETQSEVSGKPREMVDRLSMGPEGLTVRRRLELPGGAVSQRLVLRKADQLFAGTI